MQDACFTESEREQQEQLKFDNLKRILKHPQATEYYWQLVFTYSFLVIKAQLEMEDLQRHEAQPQKYPFPKRITMKKLAERAGMEYFNLKTIFMGKGYSVNTLRYIAYLSTNKVSLDAILTYDNIIHKAFLRLLALEKESS